MNYEKFSVDRNYARFYEEMPKICTRNGAKTDYKEKDMAEHEGTTKTLQQTQVSLQRSFQEYKAIIIIFIIITTTTTPN